MTNCIFFVDLFIYFSELFTVYTVIMSSRITHFPQQLIFHSLSPSVFYGGVDLKAIYPVFRSDQHYAIWYYPAGHLPPPRCNHNIHELNIQASLTSANYGSWLVSGRPRLNTR